MRFIKLLGLTLLFTILGIHQQNVVCQVNGRATKMKVYVIPGQGSDSRLFNNLKLDNDFELIKIRYEVPPKHCTMEWYARILATQIDTTNKFAIIGVSLGGMLCTELGEIIHPEKIILVSSAKCRNELPMRYKLLKYFPVNKIIPAKFYWVGAQIAQPVFEPDRKNAKETFKAMLKDKNPKFLKRSSEMIIHWKKITCCDKIVHIHGDNDHTIPISGVNADYIIENGSHMMMLTRGIELSILINKILREE